MPTVTLHRVTPDDWRSHRDLRLEMLLDAPEAFCTRHADVADLDEEGWRARTTTVTHFQARLGGRPVGSVGLADVRPDGSAAEVPDLVAMYVAPAARGTGVAALLVERVLEEARARGHSRIRLDVTETNAAARRLYERLGFTYDGTSAELAHRPGLRELGMGRTLDTLLPPGPGDVGG